jgi:hypothetical protein
VWAEAAKSLTKFPEAVVTALDADGYPVSVRVPTTSYDPDTGELPVTWPPGFALTVGPAVVLCHYHDEKLWNLSLDPPIGAAPTARNPLGSNAGPAATLTRCCRPARF